MDPVSVCCPGCGAALPPGEPEETYACQYCGRQFKLGAVRQAKTLQGHEIDVRELIRAWEAAHTSAVAAAASQAADASVRVVRVQRAPRAAAPRQSSAGCMVAMIGLLTLVGAGVAGYIALQKAGGAEKLFQQFGKSLSSERILWDSNAGPPQFALVAGKPAFLGRTRLMSGGDMLHIDAYSALDGALLWRVAGLGNYSEGYQHVRFAVAGRYAVVSDPASVVRVVDIDTGQERHRVPLTDRVEYLCPPKDGGEGTVWVKQIDERTHLLNPATGELVAAPRPAHCAPGFWEYSRFTLEGPEPSGSPTLEGLKLERVWKEGADAVGLAVKSPGTAVPYAVRLPLGLPPDRWRVAVPTVAVASLRIHDRAATVAAGRFFAAYGVGQEQWNLTALSTKGGERLWEITLRPIFAVDSIYGLVASDQHLLVMRTSSVELYEANTGKLLATIGNESYD